MTEMTRVLLVEDDPVVCAFLARRVEESPAVTLLAAVGTLAAAREACARLRPDAVLTDLGLPDGTGLTLIAELRASQPAVRSLVISVLADEASVVAAIRAGASGYLLKDDMPEDLSRFLRSVVAGEAFLSPAIASYVIRLLQPAPIPLPGPEEALSPREQAVLSLIAKGSSYAEVAARLNISVNTVGTYIKAIYRKLAVNSRSEAVFQAVSRKLISLE